MQQGPMKLIDTAEYVSALRELTEEGHEVTMLISGSSMSPFLIHHRDSIRFKKPDRPLKAGDIVFYRRSSGRYVCHRICKVGPDGYFLVGDAQTEVEGPLNQEQIFGLVIRVSRKGKWIGPGDFWWDFFEKIWLRMIPLRPPLIWLYGKITQGKRGGGFP